MEFRDVLAARHSVRAYRSDPVDPRCIERLYEAVKLAPSACNRQEWKFLVVTDPEIRRRICEVYTRPFLAEAPAIVVATADESVCWKRLDGTSIAPLDIGIAMQNLVLAATDCGLGTCWICAFDVPRMNAALGIAAPRSVFAVSPLGTPAQAAPEAPHKPRPDVFEVL